MNDTQTLSMSSVTGQLTPARIERVEAQLLECPQVDAPVVHRFSPGVYFRELSVAAGTFIIGHHHKNQHMNIMLKGRMVFLRDDGTTGEIKAPYIGLGKAGRKIAYALEDTVWINVYATTETDVEKIEDQLFVKSDSFKLHNELKRQESILLHEVDRVDFKDTVQLIGMTEDEVKEISENESDLIDMPLEWISKFLVTQSPIHGKGVFATASIDKGEVIAPARIDGKRTSCGRFTNHSKNPNARMILLPNGDVNLVATRAIKGYSGGQVGEEITVDYLQSFMVTRNNLTMEALCQQ